MKRDMELIRSILLAFEAAGTPRVSRKRIVIDGADAQTIDFHLELLKEAGFIDHEVVRPEARDGTKFNMRVDFGMCLTMDGYDFLESIKDKDIWQKTKDGAAKVGNASIGFIWEIAKAYGKHVAKEKLGFDI